MIKLNDSVTGEVNFYFGISPEELLKEYGSPLYVYNEQILRSRINEMKELSDYDNFKVNYSAKANSSLAILQIAKQEGLFADAMSPGEIYIELKAGFKPQEILFIPNNVSAEEMRYAVDLGVMVSVDSLSQLETYGKINQGGKVCIRFNSGIGVGHHEKVVTAGKNTKFAVNPEDIAEVKRLLEKYSLKLAGINHHMGSLFMEPEAYIEGAKALLKIAKEFDGLKFIDLGGGFGIPYHKQEGMRRLNLSGMKEPLTSLMTDFAKEYGSKVRFMVEPGRYIAAECGVLLGTVNAVKYNGNTKYAGSDLGFSVLIRPTLYEAHHDIEIYRPQGGFSGIYEQVTIVGNICETGDIIAKDRKLPEIMEGDIIGVLDAGAYGFVMSSNYNLRPRPAEVMIRTDGSVALIRNRDSFEDMVKNFVGLS